MSAGPRHSRKEIRDFAAWLRKQGWVYESTDSKGHTIWSHPRSATTYKLSETPRTFNVQSARREVQRMMGQKIEGKRRPKPSAPSPARPTPRRVSPPSPPLPKVTYQRPLISEAQARRIERADANRRFIEGLMRAAR